MNEKCVVNCETVRRPHSTVHAQENFEGTLETVRAVFNQSLKHIPGVSITWTDDEWPSWISTIDLPHSPSTEADYGIVITHSVHTLGPEVPMILYERNNLHHLFLIVAQTPTPTELDHAHHVLGDAPISAVSSDTDGRILIPGFRDPKPFDSLNPRAYGKVSIRPLETLHRQRQELCDLLSMKLVHDHGVRELPKNHKPTFLSDLGEIAETLATERDKHQEKDEYSDEPWNEWNRNHPNNDTWWNRSGDEDLY